MRESGKVSRPIRTRTGALIIAGCLCVIGQPAAAEDLKAADGYTVEVVNKPGMIFAGLARDGNSLLVTELGEGKLYRNGDGKTLTAFGPALPHGLDVIGDPTGPYQIARHGSTYLVTEGWTPNGSDEGPYDHALLEVNDTKVVRVVSADFLNPYHFTIDGETLYVIDAAQNSVERLNSDGTGKKTVVTFARLTQPQTAMKQLSPTEFGGGGEYAFDAVPTGIAPHGGRIYVSLFGGFPFLPGSGRIVSLTTSEGPSTLRIEVQGLNSPVDVGFDGAGNMAVLEHGVYQEGKGFIPGSGRLLSINTASGARDVILQGLTRPVSVLAVDATTMAVTCLDGKLVFLKRAAN